MKVLAIGTVGELRKLNPRRLATASRVSALIGNKPALVVWPSDELVQAAFVAAIKALTAALGINGGVNFYISGTCQATEMSHPLVPSPTEAINTQDVLRVCSGLPDTAPFETIDPYSGILSSGNALASRRRLQLPQPSGFLASFEEAMREHWIVVLESGLASRIPA